MADFPTITPGVAGAQNYSLLAGEEDGVGDWISKGIPAAGVAGLTAMWNTGKWLGSWLPGIDYQETKTADVLREMDTDLEGFYKRHKDAVEIGGFIAGSIVPGGIGLAAVKLAQAGKMTASMKNALGFASSRRDKALEAALQDIGTEGGTLFSQLNRNKIAALGWTVADNVITSAAIETAILGTLKKSPLLSDDGFMESVWNVAKGAALGGILGGGIDVLIFNKKFRDATRALELGKRPHEALIFYGNMDLVKGDKLYGLVDSIIELPDDAAKVIYKIGQTDLELATPETLKALGDRTKREGWNKATQLANELAEGDAQLGNSFMNLMVKVRDSHLTTGNKKELREQMADHLLQLKKLGRINKDDAITGEYSFLAPFDFENFNLDKLFSRAPGPTKANQQAYLRVPGLEAKVASAATMETAGQTGRFTSPADAFVAGFDIFISPSGVSINPRSSVYKRVQTPDKSGQLIINLKNGALVESAYATIGDLADGASSIRSSLDRITLVNKDGVQAFVQNKTFGLDDITSLDATTVNARYVWAHKLQDIDVSTPVSIDDLPMLDRLLQKPPIDLKEIQVKFTDGTLKTIGDFNNFGDFVLAQKERVTKELLIAKRADLDEIALKANVSREWLEGTPGASWSVPLDSYLIPNYAKAYYQIGSLQTPDGMIARGAQYHQIRIESARQQSRSAVAATMGAEFESSLIDLTADSLKKNALSTSSSRPGAFSSSDPNYGDVAGTWARNSGTQTHSLIMKLDNDAQIAMSPHYMNIRDNKEAAAELGVLTTALRRSSEKYYVSPDGPGELWIREAAKAAEKGDMNKALEILADAEAAGRKARIKIENTDVQRFLEAHMGVNGERVNKFSTLYSAQGFKSTMDSNVVYLPPIDTRKYKFFAFVRQTEGYAMGSSSVSTIVAKDEKQLRELVAAVELKGGGQFEVFINPDAGISELGVMPTKRTVLYKQDIENFKKAQGDYQYDLSLNENIVDSFLKKEGILGDYFPEAVAKNVLDDYINWNRNQATRLARTAVETRFSQQFEELRWLGRQYTEAATSQFQGIGQKFVSTVDNPFEDYIKTSLDISRKGEYRLWTKANEYVEALGQTAYKAAASNFSKALEGAITWEEANTLAKRYGLGRPFDSIETYARANLPADPYIATQLVHKANVTLANVTLRLDFFNAINNLISSPILMGTELSSIIKGIGKGDAELVGKLAELRSVAVPGSSVRVPTTSKLIANSIANLFSGEKEALLKRYTDISAVRSQQIQIYYDVLDNISSSMAGKNVKGHIDKFVEKGAQITGNNFAEETTRFVAADVMRQLSDPVVTAGKMSIAEQNAYIVTFVNRVQGNYIASQRPIAFQGVIGQAIGLFQTYQFNLMQQLLRHVENGDKKTAAIMMGLQGSIYGLNGVPFFDTVNKHLIGNAGTNPGHKDAYSQLPGLFGKDIGHWLLYGTASAFPIFPESAPSIYSRGDINPRHITVIPNPMNPTEIPVIGAGIRVVENLWNTAQKIGQGGAIFPSLLEGLEHNGLSRPLAGFAQVTQGYTTTSKGSLISQANDFDAIASLSRLGGARPQEEAVALDALYRTTAYKAKDRLRMEQLGEAVKTKLRGNKMLEKDELTDFMTQYAASGGNIEHFQASVLNWSKNSNVSVVNQLRSKLNQPLAKRLMEVMGGDPLPDYQSLYQKEKAAAQ